MIKNIILRILQPFSSSKRVEVPEDLKLEERKPIWIALSEFYLDTELSETDIRLIAIKVLESPYSLEEVKEINKYEVFPVLHSNLLDVAGAWTGFDETWLIKSITDLISKTNSSKRLNIERSYLTYKWMQKSYWKELERIYAELKTSYCSIPLPEPWYWTDQDLNQQLASELSSNHILYKKKVKTLARREDNDDVLFEVLNSSFEFAVVHLSWSKEVDKEGRWPTTTLFKNWKDVYENRIKPDGANTN